MLDPVRGGVLGGSEAIRGRWAIALVAMIVATLGFSADASAAPPRAVRALVPGPEWGALLPHHEPRRAGSDLRRGPARRGRDSPGSGGWAVSDHRHAARLGRQQDQLRVDLAGQPVQQQLLRPPRIRGRELHGSRLRRLLRRGAAAGPLGPLRQGLHPSRRHSLRGPRHPVPARPAGRPRHRQAGGDRCHGRLLRRRAEHGARLPARSDPQAGRQARAVAQPRWHAPQDRRGVSALAVVRPRRRADPQRALPRHPGRARGTEPAPDRRSHPELHQRALRAWLGHRLLLRDGAGLHPVHGSGRQPPSGLRRDSGRQAALRGRPGRHPRRLQPQQRLQARLPGGRLAGPRPC